MIRKIISGGQTGTDRAALDVALKLGIPHGGWIPKGRKAEDGPLADIYKLKEMSTDSYPKRTEQNVVDSDGTLIIARGKLTGGTDYTRKMTLRHRKQLLGIDLNQNNHYDAASLIASWIKLQRVHVLGYIRISQQLNMLNIKPVMRFIRISNARNPVNFCTIFPCAKDSS
jgi:hypothetical protein